MPWSKPSKAILGPPPCLLCHGDRKRGQEKPPQKNSEVVCSVGFSGSGSVVMQGKRGGCGHSWSVIKCQTNGRKPGKTQHSLPRYGSIRNKMDGTYLQCFPSTSAHWIEILKCPSISLGQCFRVGVSCFGSSIGYIEIFKGPSISQGQLG